MKRTLLILTILIALSINVFSQWGITGNTGIGSAAMTSNSSGNYCVAIGSQALYSLTGGAHMLGSYNVMPNVK